MSGVVREAGGVVRQPGERLDEGRAGSGGRAWFPPAWTITAVAGVVYVILGVIFTALGLYLWSRAWKRPAHEH